MLHQISEALIQYGPWGIFVLALLDSCGVPMPAVLDALVIYVAVKSPERGYLTAAMAVLGSLAGNGGLFLMARFGGRVALKPPAPGRPQRFRTWFGRYGLVTVFIPALLPIPLPLKVFVISAGVMHTPVSRFLSVILAARLTRYFGEAWLGVSMGEGAQDFLTRNAWTLTGAALALAFLLVGLIKLSDRRRAAL